MIKLIVGLGNPGSQYKKTRHNAGFLFLDRLAYSFGVQWSNEVKFHGLISTVEIAGEKVVLLKPQEFMNRSGLSVGAVVRYYKIQLGSILVVHDELDLAAGIVKLKLAGGHAGHNGLRDIISNLGDNGFCRARIGIGRPLPGKKVADYVLSKISKSDELLIDDAFDRLDSQLELVVSGEFPRAMNVLNAG